MRVIVSDLGDGLGGRPASYSRRQMESKGRITIVKHELEPGFAEQIIRPLKQRIIIRASKARRLANLSCCRRNFAIRVHCAPRIEEQVAGSL